MKLQNIIKQEPLCDYRFCNERGKDGRCYLDIYRNCEKYKEYQKREKRFEDYKELYHKGIINIILQSQEDI